MMKKTITLVMALLIAVFSVCALTFSAFADEATTVATAATTKKAAPGADEETTKAPTTAAPTTAAPTTAAPTTAAPATTAGVTKDNSPVVTNAEGVTAYDEGEVKTTKKPAAVDSVIPSTGSNVGVSVVALLALAASTAVVIKVKKNDED